MLNSIFFRLSVFSILVLSSCSGKNENQNQKAQELPKPELPAKVAKQERPKITPKPKKDYVPVEGFRFLVSNCFSCHNPRQGDEYEAPTMTRTKKAYLAKTNSREEFVKDMVAFLKNPGEAPKKMPDAVNEFGIMELVGFPDEQFKIAAEYIYDTALEEKGWYDKAKAKRNNK
ncbi:hypothetical protein [Fulvitalea axinellae]